MENTCNECDRYLLDSDWEKGECPEGHVIKVISKSKDDEKRYGEYVISPYKKRQLEKLERLDRLEKEKEEDNE